MRFKFENNGPDTESCYKGIIKRATVSNDKTALRVYVEIEEFPGVYYIKYVPISTIPNSWFYNFCYDMEIINEKQETDTNRLIGLEIACNFNESNGRYFVDDIQLYKHYTHLFEPEYSEKVDEEYEEVDFDA